MVTWIGYDAPAWSETLDPRKSVAFDNAARKGATALNSFYAGIDAVRTDDPHTAALGHSYGSLTTSLALQQGGTGADDVMLFGSPGLDTDNVADLKVPAGHVYVLEDKNDPVADLAAFGPDPNQLDGVTNLSTRHEDTPLGERSESTGHSSYLNDSTTSQYNIATVVAGVPEQAIHDQQFGIGDALNWPFSKVDTWL